MGNVGFGQDRPFQDDNGGEDAIDDILPWPRRHHRFAEDAGDEKPIDFSVLFDAETLREELSEIKSVAIDPPLRRYRNELLQILDDKKRDGSEDLMTFADFCEFWIRRGCSRDEAMKMFEEFDFNGEGVLDIEHIRRILKLIDGSPSEILSDLNFKFGESGLMSGIVDTVDYKKEWSSDLNPKILAFLRRNRPPVEITQPPSLDMYTVLLKMRRRLLQHFMNSAAKKEKPSNFFSLAPMDVDAPTASGDSVLPTRKCFVRLETSSNQTDAYKMVNGNLGDYWQAGAGRQGKNWIRIYVKPNVIVHRLDVHVLPSDHSFVPSTIEVTAGSHAKGMKQLADVKIAKGVAGRISLLRNCRRHYPVIVVGFRHNQNGGSDIRIRCLVMKGVHVGGVGQETTVFDSSALWIFSMIRSVASVAMPTSSQLRDTLLRQSRLAVNGMPPLSIAPASSERPGLLSESILNEVNDFLENLLHDASGAISSDGLHALLGLAVARGSIVHILRMAQLLLRNPEIELSVVPLLHQLAESAELAFQANTEILDLEIVYNDGGEKGQDTAIGNILETPWSSKAYLSADGKVQVNIVFQCADSLRIEATSFSLKTVRGANGVRSGLILVCTIKGEFKEEEFAETLASYNHWGREEYEAFRNQSLDSQSKGSLYPVAYFETAPEMDDIEIPIDDVRPGRYYIVKILGPRSETAERIGLVNVRCHGYRDVSDGIEDSLLSLKCQAALPDLSQVDVPFPSDKTALHLLAFAASMADSLLRVSKQQRGDRVSPAKDPCLDVDGVTLRLYWDVYSTLLDKSDFRHEAARFYFLHLLKYLLPHLSMPNSKEREDWRRDRNAHQLLTCDVYQHLSDIVDSPSRYRRSVQQIATTVIVEGAEVFFPDDETRRFHMNKVITSLKENIRTPSQSLTFESLYRFYTTLDADSLLGLPQGLVEANFTGEEALGILSTLARVAEAEAEKWLTPSHPPVHRPSDLVQLLCALQRSLCTWAYGQLTSGAATDEQRHAVGMVMMKYTQILTDCSYRLLEGVKAFKAKTTVYVERLKKSLVGMAFRQLMAVLNLNAFMRSEPWCFGILRALLPVSTTLNDISTIGDARHLFPEPRGSFFRKTEANVVLQTWTRESAHKYENNTNIRQTFECLGCVSFRLEFDQQCETEQRYDYLEFTDSSGEVRKYHGKVGSDTWPSSITIRSKNRLQFFFHSDSSTNAWGYKFSLSALGRPIISLCWAYDLHLHLATLCGQICSLGIAERPDDSLKDSNIEGSAIWKAMLSSQTFSDKNSANLALKSFLQSLSTATGGLGNELIEYCWKKQHRVRIGNQLIDSAVRATFGALLWHDSSLHEYLIRLVGGGAAAAGEPPAGVIHAFNAAESLRWTLVERRRALIQKERDLADSEPPASKKQKVDGSEEERGGEIDSLVLACREKADFLLTLNPLCTSLAERDQTTSTSSQWKIKAKNWSRLSSVTKQAHSFRHILARERKSSTRSSIASSLLEFIRLEGISLEKLKKIFTKRSTKASVRAEAFAFATDFMSACKRENNSITIHLLCFLKNLLKFQSDFPRSYLSGLEGCGADLVRSVRESYHRLLLLLMETLRVLYATQPSTRSCFVAYQTYAMHCFDFAWDSDDLAFLTKANAFEFLLLAARFGYEPVRYKDENDSEETNDRRLLKTYKEWMEFLPKAKANVLIWLDEEKSKCTSEDDMRRMNCFAALYCDQIGLTPHCMSCGKETPGTRYFCKVCLEGNICKDCYENKKFPETHSEGHEVVLLEKKCHQCNCYVFDTYQKYEKRTDKTRKYVCFGCYHTDRDSISIDGSSCCQVPTRSSAALDTVMTADDQKRVIHAETHAGHHAWMLVSRLAAFVYDLVYASPSEKIGNDLWKLALAEHLNHAKITSEAIIGSWIHLLDEERKQKAAKRAFMNRIRAMQGGGGGRGGKPMAGGGRHGMMPYAYARRMSPFFFRHMYDDDGDDDDDDADDFGGPMSREMMFEMLMEMRSGPGDEEMMMALEGRFDDAGATAMEGEAIESEPVISYPGLKEFDEKEKKFFNTRRLKYVAVFALTLPPVDKFSYWAKLGGNLKDYSSKVLLPALIRQLGKPNSGESDAHLATLGVFSQYLIRIGPEISDEAVIYIEKKRKKKVLEDTDSFTVLGQATLEYLLACGRLLLAKGSISASTAYFEATRAIAMTPVWRQSLRLIIVRRLKELITYMEEEKEPAPDVKFVHILQILAGYPQGPHYGALANRLYVGEKRKVMLLKSFQDHRMSGINLASRGYADLTKNCLSFEDVLDQPPLFSDEEIFQLLLVLLNSCLLASEKHVEFTSVEVVRVIALSMKAIVPHVRTSPDRCCAVLEAGCLPRIITLACKGTTIAHDLPVELIEITTAKFYRDAEAPSKRWMRRIVVTSKSETEDMEVSGDNPETGNDDYALAGLDKTTRSTFKTIFEAVPCPMSWLRAIYELNNRDRSQMLTQVQRSYDGVALRPSDSVLKEARKWEIKPVVEEEDGDERQDLLADFGVMRFPLQESGVDPSAYEALKELGVAKDSQVIPEKDHKSDEFLYKQRRQMLTQKVSVFRHGLFQKEARMQSFKLADALSIVYARYLAGLLLTRWPLNEKTITFSSLGHIDSVTLVCFLDLMRKLQSGKMFSNIMERFVACGSPDLIKALALTSGHAMFRRRTISVAKESQHPYRSETQCHGEVHIPGALALGVFFDPRCETGSDRHALIISSSPDHDVNKRQFYGPPSSPKWRHFDVAGDTLYYSFEVREALGLNWGFRFTVTGRLGGSFDNGYALLSSMLSHAESAVPVKDVWPVLIGVACNQTGEYRLKTFGLLLRALFLAASRNVQVDLRFLKPLWDLFNDLIDKEANTARLATFVSPTLRGLTELFYVVEALAKKWRVVDSFGRSFASTSAVSRSIRKGFTNVALASVALRIRNKASEAAVLALKRRRRLRRRQKEKTETSMEI